MGRRADAAGGEGGWYGCFFAQAAEVCAFEGVIGGFDGA